MKARARATPLYSLYRQYADPPQMVLISLPEQQAIYFSIPKVASRSMLRLCAILLKMDLPEEGQLFDDRDFSWLKVKNLKKPPYKNFWKFCIVRNPLSRLVSCYLNKIHPDPTLTTPYLEKGVYVGFSKYGCFKGGMSFDSFARAVSGIPDQYADKHFKSQHAFVTDKNGHLYTDFCGKLESIHTDFKIIQEKLNAGHVEMPHENKGPETDYLSYYTTDLLNVVIKRYEKDFELFNYPV